MERPFDQITLLFGVAFGIIVCLIFMVVAAAEAPRGLKIKTGLKSSGFSLIVGGLAFFVWHILTTSPPLIEFYVRCPTCP